MRILLKILIGIVAFLLTIVIAIVVLNVVPKAPFSYKEENNFRTKDKYPMIIPHGGAKQLAPENTIYSYEMLVNDYDAAVLEIDLALTKDNILMAHHDLDLEFSENSTMNGAFIRDFDYQEIIDEYKDDGYHLATTFLDINGNVVNWTNEQLEKMIPANLEEDIFKKFGADVLYILEIKDSPTSIGYVEGSNRFKDAADKLIELVNEYELQKNVVLASFSDDVISYFMEKAPNSIYNSGVDEVTKFSVFSAFYIDFFWNVKSQVLILPNRTSMEPITGSTASLLDKLPKFFTQNIGIKSDDGYEPNLMNSRIIKAAHRKNMAVFYWTINDPEEMKELIKLGADGIITDRPDLLKQIIDQMKADK